MIRATAMDKTIGNNIAARRQAGSLSRQDLAKTLDVTHQQLAKYEHGENRISAAKLYKLSRYFKCQTDDFFGTEERYMESSKTKRTMSILKQLNQLNDSRRMVVQAMIKCLLEK